MILRDKLAWGAMSRGLKDYALSAMPVLERRQFEKLVKGKTELPGCFSEVGAIYVHVPKVAGTSISNLFFGGFSLGHMPFTWYERIAPESCRNLFTFSFVRNPWDRAVSAYHYLLSRSGSKRDGSLSRACSGYKSFDDFVIHWLNRENVYRNILFLPQYQFLCNSCGDIALDYIGRFENLSSDINTISAEIGREFKPLPKMNKSSRHCYKEYYSERSAEVVAQLYKDDIDLFGYSF